jgi:RND family efflux transporter MFP subunit
MDFKSKKLIIGSVVTIIIGSFLIIWFFLGTAKTLPLLSMPVQKGDITEKISLNGQVKASQGVDLAFEGSGRIVANYVRVGDKIYAGQPLVAIDSSILQSQLQQAQAQLDALNINTIQNKNNAGIQSVYASSLSSAQKSVTVAKDILLNITDIQYNHFADQNNQNIILENLKTKAVYSLLGQTDGGNWNAKAIGQLNGGAFGLVQTSINNPSQDNIDATLTAVKTALQDISNMINAVPIDSSLSATERSTITMDKTNINIEIITTSANIQSIATLKVNNSAVITTTNSQIEGAQANVNAINTQISKTVLRALFDGQVDKDNIIVGSMVTAGSPVITISNKNLEIDTNIPEIDISEAKIGNNADVTLDAYGSKVIFPATIISIDTAQSMINGIPTYGAKLKFTNADERIKPGMTANINIISETHSGVLMIPKSAVIQKDEKYFVIVDKGNNQKETREVTVGLRDDKNIEVLTGLSLNENVFAY